MSDDRGKPERAPTTGPRSLKLNAFANFAGQGWTALAGIAFLPLFVKELGAESYGIIGVFAVLQAWMTMLDFGLTPTVNRETARLSAGLERTEDFFDLLRSIEWICLILGCAVVAALIAGAPWLASSWLRVDSLPEPLVTQSLRLMGFVLLARWLEQIYRATLLGLEAHVPLNAIVIVSSTFRWPGAFVVVLFVPNVLSFFVWQFVVGVITTMVLRWKCYRTLPPSARRGRFSFNQLKRIRSFAGGMSLGAVFVFLLTQIDKILISRIAPLEVFGYYMLAAQVANALLLVVLPINQTVFPRFTALFEKKDFDQLATLFLKASQLVALLVVPPAFTLVFFAREALLLWTGDPSLSAAVAPLLGILVLATMLNALMHIPYMLQLSAGWTSLSVVINGICVAALVPLTLWLVPEFGPISAGWVLVALNSIYVIVGAQLMFRRLVPELRLRWYVQAVLVPLATSAALCVAIRAVLPAELSRLEALAVVLGIFACLGLTAVMFYSPWSKTMIRKTGRPF